MAKNQKKSSAFFDKNMLDKQLWNQKVEKNMETALREEEFEVYLQPKYSPSDGKMLGAEALVRWNSKTDGFIPPNRFIPIFEENGFITQLDDYMVSKVAKLQITVGKVNGNNMELLVSVKDTGQGIREEDLGKLFGAFQQVDSKRNHDKEGTGNRSWAFHL